MSTLPDVIPVGWLPLLVHLWAFSTVRYVISEVTAEVDICKYLQFTQSVDYLNIQCWLYLSTNISRRSLSFRWSSVSFLRMLILCPPPGYLFTSPPRHSSPIPSTYNIQYMINETRIIWAWAESVQFTKSNLVHRSMCTRLILNSPLQVNRPFGMRI